MTKFETVQSLRGGEMQRAAVEKMTVLQQQMSMLPEQTQQLAAAIEPLTDLMMQISKQISAIDQRLVKLEAQLPRDAKNKRLMLASAQDLAELKAKLSESRSWFK